MSAAITAYTVNLDALHRAVGGGDPELDDRLRAAGLPSVERRRVQDLLYIGGPAMPWSEGGYALEALCRAFGQELPAAAMGRLGYDAAPRLTEVDALLDDLGVDLSWSQLYLMSGPPVPLNPARGWPRVFHLDADAVRAADTALQATMKPDASAARIQRALARARRERASSAIINGLQRWLAAWPVFGSVRRHAASCTMSAADQRSRGRASWATVEASFAVLDDLNWRAASLLEETAGWLQFASEGSLGLVGFEY